MQIAGFQLYTSTSSGRLEIISIAPDLENDQVTITWNGPGGLAYSLQSSTDRENWNSQVANNLTVESNIESGDLCDFGWGVLAYVQRHH